VLSEHVHAVVDADPELDYKVLVPSINLGECVRDLLFVEKLATIPVTMPRMTEAQGVMKPLAGVAATRPEIHPEHHPTMDHFLARR
jgi:hypothetical protein